MNNFTEFIGIDYQKVDCWGLCKIFYRKVFGLELENYYIHTPQNLNERQDIIRTNVGSFLKVESDPNLGDLILMRILGYESHIALYIGEGMLLHTTEKTGSVIEPVSRWKRRIVGFYRIKE